MCTGILKESCRFRVLCTGILKESGVGSCVLGISCLVYTGILKESGVGSCVLGISQVLGLVYKEILIEGNRCRVLCMSTIGSNYPLPI